MRAPALVMVITFGILQCLSAVGAINQRKYTGLRSVEEAREVEAGELCSENSLEGAVDCGSV